MKRKTLSILGLLLLWSVYAVTVTEIVAPTQTKAAITAVETARIIWWNPFPFFPLPLPPIPIPTWDVA